MQRVLRDYRKVERRLLARVAEKDAALEAAAAERLNGGLLGRKQVRSAAFIRTTVTCGSLVPPSPRSRYT